MDSLETQWTEQRHEDLDLQLINIKLFPLFFLRVGVTSFLFLVQQSFYLTGRAPDSLLRGTGLNPACTWLSSIFLSPEQCVFTTGTSQGCINTDFPY